MTYFIRRGSMFKVTDKENMELHEKLPVGNYTIGLDPMTGFYLEHVSPFLMPPKIYGSVPGMSKRIIATYMDRPQSTGVLLAGEKGSGKTLLAKQLTVDMAALQMPALLVNSPFTGDAFYKLLQSIEQPCVMLFDEFEKVYPMEAQNQILTLLDGVYPTKKLYVFTINDKNKVSTMMKNRPGRLYYMLEFDGLEESFIVEYARENLKPELHEYIPQILHVTNSVRSFNFDMLKAICEEMNRYGEKPMAVVDVLNVKPDPYGGARYDLQLFLKEKDGSFTPVPGKDLQRSSITFNPTEPFHLNAEYMDRKLKKPAMKDLYFTHENFKSNDMVNNLLIFENDRGVIHVKRQKVSKNFLAMDAYNVSVEPGDDEVEDAAVEAYRKLVMEHHNGAVDPDEI